MNVGETSNTMDDNLDNDIMNLPIELIEKICSFFDISDVLNLSAVNTYWRNAINDNNIWKALCRRDFHVIPSEKPLIGRSCRVSPAFEVPTNSSANLNAVCDWRIRYAQEIYILNNWKNKRFHSEDLPEIVASRKYNDYHIFNNLILIVDDGRKELIVWRLTDDGFIQVEPIPYPLTGENAPVQFYSINAGFILVQKSIISFYIFKDDHFVLKLRTLIAHSFHAEIPLLINPSDYQEYLTENYSDENYIISYNDRYFVTSRIETGSCFFIVWDLKESTTFSFTLRNERFIKDLLVGDVFKAGTEMKFADGSSPILYVECFNVLENEFDLIHIVNVRSPVTANQLITIPVNGYQFAHVAGDFLALVRGNEVSFMKGNGEIEKRIIFPHNVTFVFKCRSLYIAYRFFNGDEPMLMTVIDKHLSFLSDPFDLQTYFGVAYPFKTGDFVSVTYMFDEVASLIDLKNFTIVPYDYHLLLSIPSKVPLVFPPMVLCKGQVFYFW